jgi:hypothetical protein
MSRRCLRKQNINDFNTLMAESSCFVNRRSGVQSSQPAPVKSKT